MAAEQKDFRVDIKTVNPDEGTFTGILSVYDVVDLGGDLIEKGAFDKTLKESGGTIPCLWQHRDPVGMLSVRDNGTALEVSGQLVLDVQRAREALSLMKAGVVKGLSIGFRTIKSRVEKGVRKLTEVALMEGSVVTFPMLPLAQVTSVKAEGAKAMFDEELQMAQTLSARYMMINAIVNSLDSIAWDLKMSDEEKIAASDESITQFHKSYVAFLPQLFAAWASKSLPAEQKAGRTISAATASAIKEAITILEALLEPGAAGTLPDEGKAAGTQSAGAAMQDGTEPEPRKADAEAEIHSLLEQFKSNLRSTR